MQSRTPTALVVDDDQSLRTLCRVLLELEGFTVREAATLAEADAALAEQRPDIVLLDVHIGLEQSDALFARLRAAGVPVAAVTGTADVSDFENRADAVLSKPFAPDRLVETARRLARLDA